MSQLLSAVTGALTPLGRVAEGIGRGAQGIFIGVNAQQGLTQISGNPKFSWEWWAGVGQLGTAAGVGLSMAGMLGAPGLVAGGGALLGAAGWITGDTIAGLLHAGILTPAEGGTVERQPAAVGAEMIAWLLNQGGGNLLPTMLAVPDLWKTFTTNEGMWGPTAAGPSLTSAAALIPLGAAALGTGALAASQVLRRIGSAPGAADGPVPRGGAAV